MIEQNWQNLIKPKNIQLIETDNHNSVKILVEPLERGFGVTLGNALRRILLSSLQGSAVTAIKVDGVVHEFSAIEGVSEDITDIILNIKQLKIRSHTLSPVVLNLKVKGVKVVTAANIEENQNIEILNKDLIICNINEAKELNMQITIETGKGYSPVEFREEKNKEIGIILVDAIFSPIERVKYEVENARVGQVTDYDKLYLDITTDGSITPEEAVGFSAKILQDQLNSFINFKIVDEVKITEEKKDELPFDANLLKRIDELEFSVRSANCLKNAKIIYIGDLVQKTEAEMLKTTNFGRKSLNEIREVLVKLNLALGMTVVGWPPEDIVTLAKKYEDKY